MKKLLSLAAAVAAVLALAVHVSATGARKAVVYCPVGIDVGGCDRIVAALTEAADLFPGGVDRGYDGSSYGANSTVDLRTVDLGQYAAFVVPSLADNAESKPYALLRDSAVARRLREAVRGRVAVWSGTPDQGSASRAEKNTLIRNLANWAAASYEGSGVTGVVALLDLSSDAASRYNWVTSLAGVRVTPDTVASSHDAAQALTTTGSSILDDAGQALAYDNMASFGLGQPSGASSASADVRGAAADDGTAGPVVLVTAPGSGGSGATVQTDKADYAPGEIVTFTGSGWEPGETVTLLLQEEPFTHADRTLTATADGSGNILNNEYSPEEHDLGVTYYVTAKGQTSGRVAQTKFTDGPTVDLEAWKTLATPAGWSASTLNSGDHDYNEDESIPFRLVLKNVNAGASWSVTIGYDFADGSRRFFDWLSTYTRSVALTNTQACSGWTCTGSPTTFPIPADASLPSGVQESGVFTVFNGSITGTGATYVTTTTGSASKKQLVISGTAAAGSGKKDVIILFGGHLAQEMDWGTGNGASSFPGASPKMYFSAYSGGGPDDNLSINPKGIVQQADLAITKTDSPDPVDPGANLTYTLTVTNNGPNQATTANVSDPLPSGTTFVSATPSQGTCSGTTTVSCSLGAINAGASATITLVVQVAPTASGTISNTATVSGSPTDPTSGNNSATATTTVGALPAISISDVSQAEGNSGTTPFAFTVSLSRASAQTVTVNYATADGTATTADADYAAASGTVTFAPGEVSKTLTVAVTGDTKFEPDENFSVTLVSPTNATIADGLGQGTIANDDAQPAISIADVSANEGNTGTTPFTFAVTLSNPSHQPVTVSYATADGSATVADNDYAAATGTLTFAPGITSQDVTVQVNGDPTFELDETFLVNLSGAAGATIADGQGQGTIANDDAQPTISINDVAALEGNSGTTPFTFTVTLSSASSQTITVNYATAGGSATEGSDYVGTSGTLTFAPGTTTQPIVVQVNGDRRFEPDQRFFVNLSGAVNATIADAQGIGTIVNDDAQPTISITDVSASEGNSGTKSFTFTVSLSNPSSQIVTVGYATGDGTATVADDDYVAATGTVTFNPGVTSQPLSVPVKGDTKFEPDENFFVNLSGATNSTIADNQGVGTIANDDARPAISIADVTKAEGNSGTTAFEFTVSLSQVSSEPVSVAYATQDGTATVADADYVAVSGTLEIPAGSMSATVAVTVNGDLKHESDETFTVNLTAPVNATIADAQAVGTVTNDDSAPTVAINDVAVREGDSGTTDATFTVSLSAPSGLAVSVDFTTADGTAAAPGDYGSTAGTVTFNAGEASKTVVVRVIGDLIDEADETFTVNLSDPVNATIGRAQGVGTIEDDDEATIAINDVQVGEADGAAVFAVTLSTASARTVTVDFSTADGSATAGADYTSSSGTLTFSPGETGKTISVPVVSDATDEPNESFLVNLTNATNAAIADAQGVGTILDDDDAPAVSIADASANEGDVGTTSLTFAVSLSNPSSQTVTVGYATNNGTATTADGDYVAATGTVTFAPGETSQQISVTVHGDTKFEPDETFTVNLSSPANATIADAQGVGTILNDDAPPTISISDVSAPEGNGGTTALTFTVSLSNPSSATVTVDYATADGTARATDNDYVATSGTLTIPAGSTSGTVIVNAVGDTKHEPDETFFVDLSAPVNATIADGQGRGTILNDDPQPTVAIDDVTKAEGHNGATAFDFTVSLSNPSSEPITVNYATHDGTATVADLDYQSATGVVTFAPGAVTQSVTVQVTGDTKFEPDETFTVNLSDPSNATIAEAEGAGVGTITNDDSRPTISIDDVTANEGDAGTTAFTFTVSLSNASSEQITVNYATADGTAMADDGDYTAASGTATFAAGEMSKAVTVLVTGDAKFEPNETFSVNLSGAANATIADGQGVGTIVNDDDPPTISIDDVTVTEGDAAATVTASFTVTLSAVSGQPATVNYATQNGSASASADYVAASGTLTFLPGETAKLINVTVNGDGLDEPDETFFVSLSDASNATIADGQGQGTIVDDDPAPLISINDVSVTEGNAGTADAVFHVTLSAASGKVVTVSYATADASATAGSDYVATNGTLTFAPGETSKDVTVQVNGDATDEPDETFVVNLSGADNATVSDGQGQGTILDDDDPPTLSINDVTVSEGNAGTVDAVFSVTLSAASGKTVAVNFTTADGSATTADADYLATAGTLTFMPGEVQKAVTVQVTGDTKFEANETFAVNLSAAANATIADGQGVGTIVNDDPQPTIAIDDVTKAEGSSGTTAFDFTVTLSNPSSEPITVSYATQDGTATVADLDYQSTAGAVTFAPGVTAQTITVQVSGDTKFEPDETFTVNLSDATNATIAEGEAVGQGTIANDDAQPTISITDVSANEGNAGTTPFTFTVSLSNASYQAVTVNYATVDGTATAPADYVSAAGPLTFLPGETSKDITVQVKGDVFDEPNETFLANLSGAVNATITDDQGLGTIVDDDEPTPGKVTGGGQIPVTGGNASFGFVAQRKTTGGPLSGQLEEVIHPEKKNLHSTQITQFGINPTTKTAYINGTCTLNGVLCTFELVVVDDGEPGRSDTYTITIKTAGGEVIVHGGTLERGNVQVHN